MNSTETLLVAVAAKVAEMPVVAVATLAVSVA
jgi:hypothetical protein